MIISAYNLCKGEGLNVLVSMAPSKGFCGGGERSCKKVGCFSVSPCQVWRTPSHLTAAELPLCPAVYIRWALRYLSSKSGFLWQQKWKPSTSLQNRFAPVSSELSGILRVTCGRGETGSKVGDDSFQGHRWREEFNPEGYICFLDRADLGNPADWLHSTRGGSGHVRQ